MGKSKLTVEIEQWLLRKTKRGNNAELSCEEVSVTNYTEGGKNRNVDVLKYNKYTDRFTCYEIKISKSDFKSPNGHNFVGNLNYYVVPKDLLDYAKTNSNKKIGIIIYPTGGVSRKATACDIEKDLKYTLMFNLAKAINREKEKQYLRLIFKEKKPNAF